MKFMNSQKPANAAWMATAIFILCLLVSPPAKLEPAQAGENENILIGLDAAMTGRIGQSGTAIKRGALLAIDEINRTGGVLGRKFELTVKNHRGVPARGVDNIHDLAGKKNLVAVMGGLHTPVALAELKAIHERKLIYLGPWAAGTPIVDNGYKPNYVFRVSARDEFAGGFLIEKALERGFKKPGLLLWRTGWGRSNHKAMTAAMTKLNVTHAGVQWFNTSQNDISDEIQQLVKAGADVIMLVANSPEGLTVIKNMAEQPAAKRIPIISHWGITGADIVKEAPKAFAQVDLSFLQTYSFFTPPTPDRAAKLVKAYCAQFKVCGSVSKIVSPVGTAHAYDLVHILKRAIEAAGTIDRDKVRAALEGLDRYDGLVRTYDPPFTPKRHDALDTNDFRLCRYDSSGAIIPMSVFPVR
jgi:branched-chain amino acid transport system substrate-binding protein